MLDPDRRVLSRKYVAQFNFLGKEQSKRIHQLSGGERNRVQLAKSLSKGGPPLDRFLDRQIYWVNCRHSSPLEFWAN